MPVVNIYSSKKLACNANQLIYVLPRGEIPALWGDVECSLPFDRIENNTYFQLFSLLIQI